MRTASDIYTRDYGMPLLRYDIFVTANNVPVHVVREMSKYAPNRVDGLGHNLFAPFEVARSVSIPRGP